jgi:VanZ family protein
MATAYSARWLSAAITVSVMIVLAAPFVGQVTTAMRDMAKDNYPTVLALIVAAAALAAVAAAAMTIRHHRRERFSWIAAAILLAVGYAVASRTGVADVDAAERFHFIEYGVIAVLFYKAWRPATDGAVIVMPLVAGCIVGTLEEWLQWFVPGRVGEAKDVLLNLFSVGAGILFALGLDPPPRVTLSLHRQSRRHVALLIAIATVVFAGFFQSVHMGHEIADREAGVFLSRYDVDELRAVSASRAERWKTQPPLRWSRFSREDQFLTEGVAHVRRRNQRWDEGHLLAARHENLILEQYYAPVLDTPSYLSASGHRWPPAQRAQAEQISGPGFMIYESDALDYAVVTWSPTVYWLVIMTAILLGLRRTL